MLPCLLVALVGALPTTGCFPDCASGGRLEGEEYGLRLMQVRASLRLQRLPESDADNSTPPATALASDGRENMTHAIEEVVEKTAKEVEEVVAKAAVGSKVHNAIFSGNATPPANKSSNPNVSVAESVGNTTLQDVIIGEEEKTLTNQTVAKSGAKALHRKKHGKKTEKEKKFEETVEEDEPNSTIEDELNNKTIQKAIRARVEEAVDAEVVSKVTREHRLPSQQELNQTVTSELREIWYDLIWARRHRKAFEENVSMWKSVAFFDWSLLLLALAAFFMIYRLLRDWPTQRLFHGAALLIWVALAVLYNGMIYVRLGGDPAVHWLIGYVLEFIFSIENLFVYHIIVKAFRMPRWITQQLLFIVVVFQLAFQFVFYMGLGPWLRSLHVLPYILGVWLIYVGCQAMLEEESADFDIMKTRFVSCIQLLLGDRLVTDHDDTGRIFTRKDGKLCLCPPGLLLLCLLVADFLLEVDVTVTKIEGFPSRYLCFSSSAVATFALPELFFIARDLFHHFFALKYGISFVLIFVGAQALLQKLFTLTALTSLGVIIGVMIMSILVSIMFRLGKGDIGTEEVGPRGVQAQ